MKRNMHTFYLNDTERQYLLITDIENKETQVNGIKKIFNGSYIKTSSNQGKTCPHRYKKHVEPARHNQKIKFPHHVTVETSVIQNKQRVYKHQSLIKETLSQYQLTLKDRRAQSSILQALEDHGCQLKLFYPANLSTTQSPHFPVYLLLEMLQPTQAKTLAGSQKQKSSYLGRSTAYGMLHCGDVVRKKTSIHHPWFVTHH